MINKCCKAWKDLLPESRRAERSWQVLHDFAHSAIPWSAHTLVEAINRFPTSTCVRLDQLEEPIQSALDRGWIAVVDEDGVNPYPVYRGCLRHKR